MALFSSTQISWNEPLFFLIRIREAWGWRRRLLLALGISVLMFLAIHFFGPGQRGLAGTIGISLTCGFVLVALLDIGSIQREVTVSEDSIVVNSAVGHGWFTTFKFEAIKGVRLIRPDEFGKGYGGMLIESSDDTFLVAIPNRISLETVANVFHRLGVAVSLSGWEASDSDTRVAVRHEIQRDPAAVQGEITTHGVGDHEGPLLTPGHFTVQVVIAFGPLLLALIGAIAVSIVLYRNWADMAVLNKCLYGGGALLGFVGAFAYLVMVGQFVAASYGIRVSRKKLSSRPNAMFTGQEDDLLSVELFDRASWTAAVSRSADYGFLRVDRPQTRLLFEGNKSRWTLPFSALTACRIEESLVGSEGNPNAEKRYFVVIAAHKDGEPWEAGMVHTRTEMGNDTAESRYKRAQYLFMQLAEGVV